MMSFGGNDIGFADVIRNCIGVDWDAVEADAALWYGAVGVVPTLGSGAGAGCSSSEEDLKSRIRTELVDNQRLQTLYDAAAQQTSSGGLIVVTGYPQLFSTPELWSAKEKLINRCNRVSEGDVRALRGATGALNQTIGEAVNQARQRHPDRTWVFVDVAHTFEDGTLRANLCGNLDAINGFAWNATRSGQGDGSAKSGFSRSYHPNQTGHALYAKAVIRAILVSGWSPSELRTEPGVCTDEAIAADLGDPDAYVIDGLCENGWVYAGRCRGDECGDHQVIARVTDGRWSVFTGFPTPLCRQDVVDAGAPRRIVDRINWSCDAVGSDVLRVGSSGDDVRRLQVALASLGYDLDTSGVDAQFGPATEAARTSMADRHRSGRDGRRHRRRAHRSGKGRYSLCPDRDPVLPHRLRRQRSHRRLPGVQLDRLRPRGVHHDAVPEPSPRRRRGCPGRHRRLDVHHDCGRPSAVRSRTRHHRPSELTPAASCWHRVARNGREQPPNVSQ